MRIKEKDLKKIFSQILKIKINEISNNLSMNNNSKWDSMNHLKLIIALEGKLKVSFKEKDIPKIISFKLIKQNLIKSGYKIL